MSFKDKFPLCKFKKVGYYPFPFIHIKLLQVNKHRHPLFNKNVDFYLRTEVFFSQGKYSMWIKEYKKGSNQLTNQIQICDFVLKFARKDVYFYMYLTRQRSRLFKV